MKIFCQLLIIKDSYHFVVNMPLQTIRVFMEKAHFS